MAIFYVVAIAYFAIAGRHRLVLSPEEEFALTQGEHGHPEHEGYGHTRLEALGHPHLPPREEDEEAPPPAETRT